MTSGNAASPPGGAATAACAAGTGAVVSAGGSPATGVAEGPPTSQHGTRGLDGALTLAGTPEPVPTGEGAPLLPAAAMARAAREADAHKGSEAHTAPAAAVSSSAAPGSSPEVLAVPGPSDGVAAMEVEAASGAATAVPSAGADEAAVAATAQEQQQQRMELGDGEDHLCGKHGRQLGEAGSASDDGVNAKQSRLGSDAERSGLTPCGVEEGEARASGRDEPWQTVPPARGQGQQGSRPPAERQGVADAPAKPGTSRSKKAAQQAKKGGAKARSGNLYAFLGSVA